MNSYALTTQQDSTVAPLRCRNNVTYTVTQLHIDRSRTWKSVLPQPRMNSASPVNTRDMSSSAYDTQPCSDPSKSRLSTGETKRGSEGMMYDTPSSLAFLS
jgi:hypothetical protein